MATLDTSQVPAALVVGNLLSGVLPSQRRGDGLSFLGGGERPLPPLSSSAPGLKATMAVSRAPAALVTGNLLGSVLPVRRRVR